jgi:ElaB/YqjD/DUF883 family membrane-anchored ribosome-binding protein
VTTLDTITETVSDLGKQAKQSAEELGRRAGRKLGEAQDETGDALHATASTIRTTGRKGSEAIGSLANGAADRLDATASCVEDCDLTDGFTSLRRFARRHLTGSVVTAAAIGFLAGSALSRMTHTCGRSPEGTTR